MTERKQGWFKASGDAGVCPAADELWSLHQGDLTAERRDTLREHLIACVWCGEKAARFADTETAATETVPTDLNQRTRRLWTANPIQKIWRSPFLWMTLFLGSLAVSFTTPRYYKQFLVIALVSGIRWAINERTRHSITITQLNASSKDRLLSPHSRSRT